MKSSILIWWEQLGSNQRLPSCKGGALNQLSYAPKESDKDRI